GVPPSSLSSILSKYLCSPHGFVQLTVPPPGWSGIMFLYSFLLKIKTPEVPGPPKNLCGERKTACKYASESGCISISTYGAEIDMHPYSEAYLNAVFLSPHKFLGERKT